ncbi:zf-HC2 domain-containing protein [Streptomyces sp. NPDC001822]|uniref:zf-HC2 domain-containing protein n=1 Tax=Streptomyces sp. NPDC001822 TaxID=3364614 RepID=UPI0036BB44DF
MRAIDSHRDAGAYALGVLGAADAFRFEEHLTRCSVCAVQLREFDEVVDRLVAYSYRMPGGAARAPAVARGSRWPGRVRRRS